MSEHDENRLRRFLTPREGGNRWAQREDVIDAWLKGIVEDVMPMMLEYAPSLRCNLDCSGTCPYRAVRRGLCAARVGRGQFAESDDEVVSSLALSKIVLERSIEAGAEGVLWTGGGTWEVCPDCVEMVRYAAGMGLHNAAYTNGIQFGEHPDLAAAILAPESNLVFLRFSENVATPEAGLLFSHATPEDVEAQYRGLENALQAREQALPRYREAGKPLPQIQVSTICDRRNVGELRAIAQRVAAIHARAARPYRDPGDCLIVRPLTVHGRASYRTDDHPDSVIQVMLAEFGRGGASRAVVEESGMRVYLGFGLCALDEDHPPEPRHAPPAPRDPGPRTYEAILKAEYAARDNRCWANGLFLTAGPNADVHLCTDRNCFPDWSVGNLKTQTVKEIYHGERRRQVLDRVQSCHLGPEVCEPTCRAVRLNAIARAIRSGELTLADIAEIRRRSYRERPPLLS